MKVLFVNQVLEENNKYTFSLARALIRNGIDVTVCGIEKDDVSALDELDRFTIAQISSFIDVCNKGKCVNCLAVLLDQKNRMIDGESVDVLSEFTLED